MNDATNSPANIGNTPTADPATLDRRRFLEKLCLGLAGICTAVLGVPVVGFVLAPLFRKTPNSWVNVGKIGDFAVGQTVNVTIVDPSSLPWAGITARSAAWLRRESESEFIAFSVNCTHLGCPVRWMNEAGLFMCPCHGGVFYKNGEVAAGPPQHPLPRYNVRVQDGQVQVEAAPIPIQTALS
jgi:menaquinol-cytochrome c reductase iron-sulfur subunit